MTTVLDFLRNSKKEFVSGEEISRKLKVSRSAIWKEIQNLRQLGYEIDAQPHLGYRLAAIPDKLFADEVMHGLDTKIVGRSVFSYEELDSTNDAAFRLGERGVKEGACVLAEHQTKGRGRLGRSWSAPKGKCVLLSVLLRPKMPPSGVPKITLMAAVSVVRAIEKTTGKTPGIKWPNDVLFSEKKVCGILTEMSAESDSVHFAVLGIGVNINASVKDLPPGSASLKEIARRDVSRLDFARALLRELDADYERLRRGRFDGLAAEWEERSLTTGKRVTVNLMDRQVHGQAVGIDPSGALWVRTDTGLQEKVLAGDVRHLRG